MITIKITNLTTNAVFEVTQDHIGTLEGWEYASVRNTIEDVSGDLSSIYVASKQGQRRFSFISYLADQCDDDRRAMLAALRQTGILKLLEFTTLDNLELRAEVEVLALRYPYTHVKKPFLIELVAPDWRFYSQEEFTEEILPDDTGTVTNDGNEFTDTIIRITGPADNVVVTNLATGDTFSLSANLTGGQVLEINSRTETVEISSSNQFAIYDGDFIKLNPGDNDIMFEADNSTGATKLEVIYRDAYLGV